MNSINTQYITLDLNVDEIKAVKFKQYNKNSQQVVINVTENGQPFIVDKNTMVCYFKMITPSGKHKYDDGNIVINDDGTITVMIKESYCLSYGRGQAEIDIVDKFNETQICTMNLFIIISGSVYSNDIIEDSDEFSALTKLITENENTRQDLINLETTIRHEESIRSSNEDIRISNENARIANENIRIESENSRISNETGRENAEEKRETDFNTSISNANIATSNAVQATENAEIAAQNTINAINESKDATQKANTIAEEMRSLIASDNIIHVDKLGIPRGVATLDEEGFLTASQIPDRTIEYYYGTLETDPETGLQVFTSSDGEIISGKVNKCYIDTNTNIPYIWSGVEFIPTGSTLSLGTTSATAFPGDRGLELETRMDNVENYHNNTPASNIKFNNENTAFSGATVQDVIVEVTQTATQSKNGLLSSDDKKKIDNYSNIIEIEITLLASSWTGSASPYSQTIVVNELLNYNNCSIELNPNATPEQKNAILNAEIFKITYSDSLGLTFTAKAKPSIDIPILLCVGASMNVVSVPEYFGETSSSGNNQPLPIASATVLGGVKIGYVQNGRNFPVQLDNEQMYVNVPESAGTGGSGEWASKEIYGDTFVSMGRKDGTGVGMKSFALGYNVTASSMYSHAEGYGASATNTYAHAVGYNTIASGQHSDAEGYETRACGMYSHAEGRGTEADGNATHAEGYETRACGTYSHAEGYKATAYNFASHVSGKHNKAMTIGAGESNQVGDAFVIGNGTGSANSNALRVTYSGDIYGTKAFQSSGADYAEFIKPWWDGNLNDEDRVGYFVTVKDGLLYKANDGEYIAGITSGNPSIVGNADEDYYWRYERDEFNRIVMEGVPETVQLEDEDGNPVFDEETHEPVMVETGNIVPNARMKLAEGYDPSLQESYIERKYRKEWDYVGMLGVLPVRDDGTCIPNHFCKCGGNGIATFSSERGFDTFYVMDRVSENVISVIIK